MGNENSTSCCRNGANGVGMDQDLSPRKATVVLQSSQRQDSQKLGGSLTDQEGMAVATSDSTSADTTAELSCQTATTSSDEGFVRQPHPARAYTKEEEKMLEEAKMEWTDLQSQNERRRREQEFQQLISDTKHRFMGSSTRRSMPANRYWVVDARLPTPDDRHVPVLALINPYSGAMAGSDILDLARLTPGHDQRFFNIIDVVKDQRRGGLLDVFRLELCNAKEEAKAKGVRPRLISGGGDGTASFSLFVLFAALRADPAEVEDGIFEDQGNGFIWSDEDMAKYFPAIAQMPLGSANDFGHTLGWGQKYPGDAHCNGVTRSRTKALADLRNWVGAVMDRSTRIANFDVYGILPEDGCEACDFKLAELSGKRGMNPKVNIAGKDQLLMKEAGLPVPLFLCLYFSAGFAAYMTARFQMNRRHTPIRNKLEYGRQGVGIACESVPPQLQRGLDGVKIKCGSFVEDASEYFPPRAHKGTRGRSYREVGFLNINWQAGLFNGADRAPACGRVCATREPAKFNDGHLDMYRWKFSSLLRNPTLCVQTDKKKDEMTLEHCGGRGKGIFFQWDGEARFAFSPTGDAFHIHIRKMLCIPVVLGPSYDAKVTGDPDNGLPVQFSFSGTETQQQACRSRILRGVSGDLNHELLATRSDMEAAGLYCQEPPAQAPASTAAAEAEAEAASS